MMTFYRRHTASSVLNGAALVFALLLQSVHSYVPIDDEEANINILIQSGGGGDAKISGENDTEFPGRKLDTLKVKRRLDQYDRQILLFEHNTHRGTTHPLASDMVFMVNCSFMRLATLFYIYASLSQFILHRRWQATSTVLHSVSNC